MNPKVLLIDDDELVLDLYNRLLGRLFELRTVSSGKAALDILLTDGPFAVVVSDMRMPGFSGVDLLRRVRAISPQSSRFLMTGLLDVSDLKGDEGLAAVISKPCPMPDLIEILRQAAADYCSRVEATAVS